MSRTKLGHPTSLPPDTNGDDDDDDSDDDDDNSDSGEDEYPQVALPEEVEEMGLPDDYSDDGDESDNGDDGDDNDDGDNGEDIDDVDNGGRNGGDEKCAYISIGKPDDESFGKWNALSCDKSWDGMAWHGKVGIGAICKAMT